MHLYKDRSFLSSVGVGFLLLLASLVAVFYSTNYASMNVSNSVTDIVLSNTRVYDVGGVFVYGALLFVVFLTILIVARPHYLPFTIKSIAFLYFVRSLSVSLTHIGPYPDRLMLDMDSYLLTSKFFRIFFTGDDLFFSGHVALPFLLALIFWDNALFRAVFLIASAVFAIVVLLGHLHYSIDVFSAYFITYSVYILARRAFRKDFARIATHAAPVV